MTFAVRRILGFALALSLAVPVLADSASDALKALEDGNARFVAGKPAHPHTDMDRVSSTGANGQKPLVTILACSDSRVALERIFDLGIGDAFVVRVAGNVSDTDEIGSAEYGTGHLNTPLMVVLGHTKCGAVTAVATGAALHGSISDLVANITPAVERARKKHPGLEGNDLVPFAIEENVFQSVRDILVNSDTIRGLVRDGKLRIVAALYDIDTGKVNWLGAHPEQSALLTAPAAAHSDHAAAPGHGGGTPTASKVSSNGDFTPAELQIAKRGAFGPKAGKAEEVHAVGELADESSQLFQLFLGAAGVALVLTAGAAWMLARTTRADGTHTRTLTIGAKLAGGFGTIVTGTLVLAAVSSGASSTVAHAMAETEHLSDQDLLIAGMQGHQLETQIHVKSFLLTPSEDELVKYSNSTASLEKTWELARNTIKSPERAKLVEDLGEAIESYEETFAEIVKHVDERNAIIDGVMRPAASRATELLSEIATLAWADGQRELGFMAGEANERYQEARINFFVFLRTGDPKFAKEAVRLAEVSLHEMTELERKITNPNHKLLLKEAAEAIPFWTAQMERAEKLQEERNELVTTRLDKLGPQINDLGHELLASLSASKEEVVARSHEIQNAATMKTTVLAGITALMGAMVAFAIARGVIKGLKTLEVRLIDIAQGEGDLTKRVDIKSCDEVGRIAHWMNAFIANLHSVISQASGATTQVAAAATEVAASAEEMAAAVSEVARQSTAAASQSESSGKVATQGGNIVRSTVDRMNEIETAVNESAASVAALGKRGDEIGQVISVINDIADQTNLLALNAAIEAARAGEHGRGFAVVADEVRKLADRTTKATEEIGESIKAIQNETGLAVGRMDRGREQVKLGVENAVQAGSSLEQIVAGTRDVASMIMAISAASEEAGAGASQSASAATELSSKAELLRTLVERFKV